MRLSEEEYQALLKRGHVREVRSQQGEVSMLESRLPREKATAPPANTALLPPGAVLGTSLPLRLTNTKSRHEHWRTQSKRTRIQRHYVFEHLMALWEDGPQLGLPLIITLTRIAPGTLDEGDNLAFACSAVRDACADWLCGQYLKGQDRQEGLAFVYKQKRIAPAFYAVEITVERPKKGKMHA